MPLKYGSWVDLYPSIEKAMITMSLKNERLLAKCCHCATLFLYRHRLPTCFSSISIRMTCFRIITRVLYSAKQPPFQHSDPQLTLSRTVALSSMLVIASPISTNESIMDKYNPAFRAMPTSHICSFGALRSRTVD